MGQGGFIGQIREWFKEKSSVYHSNFSLVVFHCETPIKSFVINKKNLICSVIHEIKLI